MIIRAVEDLPAGEVSEEQRVTAQEHLVMLAAEHDAKPCGSWRDGCSRCLPRRGGPREAEALEREERRARERTRFAMRDNGDGTSSGWFKLPTCRRRWARRCRRSRPRRQDLGAWFDAEGKKLYPVLLGQAFSDLIEHLPTDALPQAGGTAATVVITMELERLRQGLGAATPTPEAGSLPRRPGGWPATPAWCPPPRHPVHPAGPGPHHSAAQRAAAHRDGHP